jgi:hypothetical protein
MAERGNKAVGEALVKNYKDGDSCPVATVDVALNTKNRNIAIEERGYGPMNPGEPNEKFWKGIADLWGISSQEAKSSRCGNCAAFIQTPKMLACIENHLGLDDDYAKEGSKDMAENRSRTLKAADLGYCQLFAFKCAADRTCRAWLFGGPIK